MLCLSAEQAFRTELFADSVGLFTGTVLGVLTAFHTGGGSMYAIAWPISGLFMLCLAAVLGEMASTWPVAGGSTFL